MKRASTSIAYQLTAVQFANGRASAEWRPTMNVYRCEERLIVCLDLAGVEVGSVQVEVLGHTMRLRGRRSAPEPDCHRYKVLQVLALEIDHGRFEREIHLPFAVSDAGMKIEHQDGYLWVDAPVVPT